VSHRYGLWAWPTLAAVGVAGVALMAAHPPRRPNVVVILVDTLRADHLPVYGYERPTAPFLTRLAGESAVFERAWSTSGWTAPATASLFTSLYPQQHGVVRGFDAVRGTVNRIPAGAQTMAEALRAAGYRTYAVSDNVLVSPELGFDRGFDVFEASTGASVERVNKWIRDRRAELSSGGPYFLYVHYMEPHEPYLPHEPWFREFSADGRAVSARPRHFVAAYDSEIRALDESLSRLYRAMGWDEDTVLVVTSDHGEEFGDHGGGGHGHSLFSELLRVPLIVRGPGLVARRIDEPVSLVDVLPTLRTLVTAPAGPHDEGVSLAGLLRGGSEGFDRPLFAHLEQFKTHRVWSATLEGEWKRIALLPGGPLLFNLADDPGEHDDLAAIADHATDRLASRALELEQRLPAPRVAEPAHPSARTLEALRALGYTR
jgi:arylsulfatase A-like enzyme